MEMAQDNGAAVPMTILTGFLGAGKTTLLNRLLTGDHGLRVAVLVNDFGSINIDAELVVGVESDVISLANGCVCCTIRDDLVETVLTTINRPERPEYILLEASGVADPGGIFMTFNDPNIRDRVRLDSVTCVVDAEQVFAHADNPMVTRLKMMQIACADMVILNKVDLAGPAQMARVHAWIDEHYQRVRVIEAVRGNVPLEVLLAVGRYDPGVASTGRHRGHACGQAGCEHSGQVHAGSHGADAPRDHGALFSTWSFEADAPVSLEALREMVRRELPASIYRCKGIVHAAEAPDRRGVLQVVGRRSDVSFDGNWGAETPRTRIVAIGAQGAIDAVRLRSLFERCLACV
jgi:G3E family GTPase